MNPSLTPIPSMSQPRQFAATSQESSPLDAEIEGHSIEQLRADENDAVVPSRPCAGDALSLQQIEQAHIRGVLANSPSLEVAAKTLGIDVSTLYRKRKLYGLR